jgi:hypothetical protein
MNEGGFPVAFGILLAAAILSAFGIVGMIVGKVLVGF